MNNAVRNTADKEMVVSLSLSHSLIHIWSICNHTRAHRTKKKKKKISLLRSMCTAAPKMNDRHHSLLATLTVFVIKKKNLSFSWGPRDATERRGVHGFFFIDEM
jgi:hypothetical protein